jgi:hypothetical protein
MVIPKFYQWLRSGAFLRARSNLVVDRELDTKNLICGNRNCVVDLLEKAQPDLIDSAPLIEWES